MIKVMKASAGAGKTYNLAKTYIRILLEKRQDRFAYKHILAVTFTNKATAEMKTRILNELHVLARQPQNSPYFNDFVPSLVPDAGALAEAAGLVLSNILHDYSAFAVSTIDKFFQQTLKAFSREIGQFASYQVELDRDSLVAESVDRLLDSVTEQDKKLLDWLKSNVLEQIENGGSYRVDANLTDIAQRILSVERQEALEKSGAAGSALLTKEQLAEIRKACRTVIKTYEKEVQTKAQACLDALQFAAVDPADSNRGFLKGLYNYVGGETERVEKPTDSFLAKAPEPEEWFSKAKRDKLLPQCRTVLEAPLNAFLELFGKPFSVYNTAVIIDRQLFGMGVAQELSEIFRGLMKERNVLCLDDSNTILRNIIDGSDAPFIYEKIGVKFENFLLDEFQDTSRVQWENFRPLLQNSVADGHENLVVGDVKQSIYRWRGSDWKLFDEDVYQDFRQGQVCEENLKENYRSLENVIRFNNGFFSGLAKKLDQVTGDPAKPIARIYSNVEQDVGRQKAEKGSVEVMFCDKDAEVRQVLRAVNQAMARGAKAGDIAVLVRSRATGEKIAVALIEDGKSVITDDSLRVKSSVIVRRLVALLSYVDNPVDAIAAYMVSSLEIRIPENCHSLIDLAENLYRQLRAGADETERKCFEGEVLHVQSFMDALQDYVAMNGNDLRGFLKDWEEQDPSISSPSGGDSIRVMTVHKSKGLDFPFVIVPFVESVTLFKPTSVWCRPELDGTDLAGCAEGVYDVSLSARSEDTLFAAEYRRERFLQLVDNINVLYVAMTRASKGMYLIAAQPEEKHLAGPLEKYNMADFLYGYVTSGTLEMKTEPMEEGMRYLFGEAYDFAAAYAAGAGKAEEEGSGPLMEYPSFPLNPEEGDAETDVRERGRLKFSADAVDFFSEDGESGVEASHRIKGIVYHDILAHVIVEEDLDPAVDAALADGTVNLAEAEEIRSLLRQRIAAARDRGWFPENPESVRNEVSIIDTDGRIHRPDRVVIQDGKVTIIDYKFGHHDPRYDRQIAAYAQLYGRMGWSEVSTYLWFVLDDIVR